MDQILASELQKSSLPEKLPKNSRLKVWVRSTGYEVQFPERKSLSHPGFWFFAIAVLSVLSIYLLLNFSEYWPYHYLFVVLPLPVVTIMLIRLFIAGHSHVRLDITPMTIAVNRPGAGNRLELQEHVPLKEIESFYIDDNRGLGLNSTIAEILYQTWIGRGLHKDDLYYLASLIVESSKLSMQNPHPGSV